MDLWLPLAEMCIRDRFLSLEDFWQKTKVPKTTIDLMAELGIFGDLPRSNQLSLFDLEFTG